MSRSSPSPANGHDRDAAAPDRSAAAGSVPQLLRLADRPARPAEGRHAETLPPELGREAIQQRLQDKPRSFGYAPARTIDAVVDPGYVMAAMADEVMLMDWGNWRDRGAWADQPLERRSMARAWLAIGCSRRPIGWWPDCAMRPGPRS